MRFSRRHVLPSSSMDETDCLMPGEEADMATFREALDCHVSCRGRIERTGIKDSIDQVVAFEFYQESYDPTVPSIAAGLQTRWLGFDVDARTVLNRPVKKIRTDQ
jgi:hypothetical protein